MAEPTPPTASEDAGRADPAGVGTLERDVERARPPRRRGATRVLRDARVAWAVAVLAVLAAAVSAYQWQTLAGQADARVQAREAAEVMAARITTFDGAEIDQFVERVKSLATGEYAEEVSELFGPDFRAALRDGEVESVGEVVRSFVQELDGDEAEVFVIVRQTSLNAVLDEPVTDELRMELRLARQDGRWLIADVAVLGPSPSPLAAPSPAEPEAAPSPAEPEAEQG